MSRRDDAPRDLFFALLALSTGQITSDQLVTAFGQWNRSPGSRLADILVTQRAIDEETRELLTELATRQLRKHGGDAEPLLESLAISRPVREKLAEAAGPDLAGTILRGGSAEETESAGASDPDATASFASNHSDASGGRFRILRPLARGGLGEVSVALDTELNREVALKQVRGDLAEDPFTRHRFLVEAEITGRLEHPGIVPVYSLGSREDGRLFYAMRLIGGHTLERDAARFHADESLRADPGRRATELQKLIRRFLDVCNAIRYAHSRGVLHRDIKPINIVVGEYGETVVLDWGLAKASGQPSEAEAEKGPLEPSADSGFETVRGKPFGTPAYMSPEQAEGSIERIGPASDIYSLGATLYFLLTGRPAFQGREIADILKAVREGDFPRPRHHQPWIDRPLEAICLKAMALKPADRYPSCEALADDLARWMSDEPVSVYREPFARRARRWARRHRVAAAAALSALILTVPMVMLIVYNNSLRREANRRFELAIQAAQSFSTGVSRDLLLKQEGFGELKGRLLEEPDRVFRKLEESLAERGADDPKSRLLLARAKLGRGDILAALGKSPDATGVFTSALDALGNQQGPEAALLGGVILCHLGRTEVDSAPQSAIAHFREAEGRLKTIRAEDPSKSEADLIVCEAIAGLGLTHFRAGHYSDAQTELRRAAEALERLVSAPSSGDEPTIKLADVRSDLGLTYRDTGKLKEGAEQLAAAIRAIEALPGAKSESLRERIAGYRLNHSSILAQDGRIEEAAVAARSAIDGLGSLTREIPNAPTIRAKLAVAEGNLGFAYLRGRRWAEAETAYRRAIGTGEKALAMAPDQPRFVSDLAKHLSNLALVLTNLGRLDESLAASRRAADLLRSLIASQPGSRAYRERLADILANTSKALLLEPTRAAEAVPPAKEAADLYESLVEGDLKVANRLNGLGVALMNLGLARNAAGDTDGALDAARRSIQVQAEARRLSPDDTSVPSSLIDAHYNYADILILNRRVAEAIAAIRARRPLCDGNLFELSDIARDLARCAAIDRDPATSALAIAALREAVSGGWKDLARLASDKAWDTFRDRDDFRQILESLGDRIFPPDPFEP